VAAWPHAARTQQSKVPVIGFLSVASAQGSRSAAFYRGLRELGYIEGTNIAIEYRWADYRLERLPALAAELVARKVEIIVALEPPAAYAAAKATTRIPIVMRSTGDPVQEGLVASIARPGGNVTGLSSESSELYGKRLEFLKELKSGIKRAPYLGMTPAPSPGCDPTPSAPRRKLSGSRLFRLRCRRWIALPRHFRPRPVLVQPG
jgi:putative ABC transport system substrate-binding protein